MRFGLRGWIVALAATGCASSYQSARLLAPGKTQVTVGATRTDVLAEDDPAELEEATWFGDVQVRHGTSERVELGARLARSPGGANGAVTALQLDPKLALTAPDATTAISIGIPFGLMWTEEGASPSDYDDGMLLVTPTLYVGARLAPTLELVVAPKLFFIKPNDGEGELEVGGSIGLRFHDVARTWAVQPELGLLRIGSEGESETFLSFGIGIAAGN